MLVWDTLLLWTCDPRCRAREGGNPGNFGCVTPGIVSWRWEYTGTVEVAQTKSVCLQCRRPMFNPWVGKIPWKREYIPIPVFLPEEFLWTEEPGRLQSMGSQRVRHD